jgi:hypothetical protein
VNEDSDTEPIGFGADATGGLLRSHVGGGSHDVSPYRALVSVDVADKSEVEEHQPSRACDADIAWLDVAVNFVGAVKDHESFGKLEQAATQALMIEAAVCTREARRVF